MNAFYRKETYVHVDSEAVRTISKQMEDHQTIMNLSRGAIHFHRLFTLPQLAVGNCEPFTDRIIRKFVEIGEAVAGRWIEMPRGILIFQLVPGQLDSGAIYLYDREHQAFYLVWFDGEDDHLTLAEFNQLLSEYRLIQYAEQPNLIQLPPSGNDAPIDLIAPAETNREHKAVFLMMAAELPLRIGRRPVPHTVRPLPLNTVAFNNGHVWFQSLGSA